MLRNLAAITFAAVATFTLPAHADRIDDMLSVGQTTVLFGSPSRGNCVGALGFSTTTSKKNRDRQVARDLAYEELGAFISGRNVSSSSRSRIESVNGKSAESFFSSVQTNMNSFLSGTEVKRSGTFEDQTYVYLEVCEKQIQSGKSLQVEMDSNRIEARGVAALNQGVEKARRMALDDALRNAVAQYTGVSTVSQSTIQDAEKLRSKQATRTSGHVEKYRVIDEGKTAKEYFVVISAIVVERETSQSNISEAVRENLGRPSIYIDTTDQLARKELSVVLKSNKFDITNNQSSARFIMRVSVLIDEQPALADMLGRTTTLDISLEDKMSNEPAIRITNIPSDSLEVSDNQRIRSSRSMKYAVDSISEDLISGLKSEFVEQFNNGAKVEVSFRNFGKMRFVDGMKDLLESFPLTKQVSARPVIDGIAYFDVLYLGDPNELQLLAVKNAHKFRLMGLKAVNKGAPGLQFSF